MKDSRTFNNEIDAVNQLIEWKNEMEQGNWTMAYNFGRDEIRMKRHNGNRETGIAKLYIA